MNKTAGMAAGPSDIEFEIEEEEKETPNKLVHHRPSRSGEHETRPSGVGFTTG